jgi:hypothetical protein
MPDIRAHDKSTRLGITDVIPPRGVIEARHAVKAVNPGTASMLYQVHWGGQATEAKAAWTVEASALETECELRGMMKVLAVSDQSVYGLVAASALFDTKGSQEIHITLRNGPPMQGGIESMGVSVLLFRDGQDLVPQEITLHYGLISRRVKDGHPGQFWSDEFVLVPPPYAIHVKDSRIRPGDKMYFLFLASDRMAWAQKEVILRTIEQLAPTLAGTSETLVDQAVKEIITKKVPGIILGTGE